MPYQAGSGHRDRPPRVHTPNNRHRAVDTSEDARHVLQLLTVMHGPVVLYLPSDSDGHTPICLRRSDFHPDPDDVLAGRTAGPAEFWMAGHFHVGLEDIDVSIDVHSVPGSERRTSSLETACGFRFALRIHAADDAVDLVEEAS